MGIFYLGVLVIILGVFVLLTIVVFKTIKSQLIRIGKAHNPEVTSDSELTKLGLKKLLRSIKKPAIIIAAILIIIAIYYNYLESEREKKIKENHIELDKQISLSTEQRKLNPPIPDSNELQNIIYERGLSNNINCSGLNQKYIKLKSIFDVLKAEVTNTKTIGNTHEVLVNTEFRYFYLNGEFNIRAQVVFKYTWNNNGSYPSQYDWKLDSIEILSCRNSEPSSLLPEKAEENINLDNTAVKQEDDTQKDKPIYDDDGNLIKKRQKEVPIEDEIFIPKKKKQEEIIED
jgi:hypothetical protein